MNNTISCEIIKDLIPNYIDNVVSKESREIVGNHINNCIDCRNYYEQLSSEINLNINKNNKVNYLKKTNIRFLITLISLLLITVASNIILIFYTEANFEEGILTLIFLIFAMVLIMIKFVIPLVGLVYSIIYLKKTGKKVLFIPTIICSLWIIISLSSYVINLINNI